MTQTNRDVAGTTYTSDEHEADKASLETLQQLRDEIRLQVHLAGMGAKDKWQELEGQFETVARNVQHKTDTAAHIVEDAKETARGALEDLRDRFELFRETLRDRTGH